MFYHPFPLGTPVDLVAVIHAMNAPKEAGPTFSMGHSGLVDVGALETASRVVHDLMENMGTARRISTQLPAGAEQTAITTWQKASDMVGVPISTGYQPWMETSPRVVRVGAEGHPDAAGGFVRVLPKGLAVMRGALDAASRLAGGTAASPWDRLQELIAAVAEIREELRVPRSGTPAGAQYWQAGYQLAAGIALGLTVPAELATAVTPIAPEQLAALLGDAVPVTDARQLAARLAAEPGARALVHRAGSGGGGSSRWLVSHDGALWWVDLAASADEATTRFDPEDSRHLAALTEAGVSVRMLTPAPSPEPSFAPKSGLVDALIDPVLGRRAAGMLNTRPRPQAGEVPGIGTGATGPEALIQAEFDAVAADLRGSDPRRQFDAVDDLISTRLPAVRARFAAQETAQEQARIVAMRAVTAHTRAISRLDDAIRDREREIADNEDTLREFGRRIEEAESNLAIRRTRHEEEVLAFNEAERAARTAPAGTTPAQRQTLAGAVQDAMKAVGEAKAEITAVTRQIKKLTIARDSLISDIRDARAANAADRASRAAEGGQRNLQQRAGRAAIEARDTALADQQLVDANLAYLRSLAADWAGLEYGDVVRTADRVAASETAGSATRTLHDTAAAEVTAIFGRAAAVTPEDVGRLAYLGHLDKARTRVETAHRAGLPALRATTQAHIDRLVRLTGRAAPSAAEMTRMVDAAVSLKLWTDLSDAFDSARPAAEQARADAADQTRVLIEQGGNLGELLNRFTDRATRRVSLPQTGGYVASLGTRTELVNAPSAPWFLRERGVLGDGYVRRVNDHPQANGIATFARTLTTAVKSRLGSSTRPWKSVPNEVETWLTKQLVSKDERHWEKMIESGVGRDFNGRFVRVHVRPANPAYQIQDPQGLKPGEANMHVRGADIAYSRSRGGGGGWGLPLGAAVFFETASEIVRFAIGPIARFFVGGSRRWSETASGSVQAENMIFTGDFATHQFGADAQVIVEVDGQQIVSQDLAGHLVLAMPQLLSSKRDEVDPATVGAATRVNNPAALLGQDFAVSAATFEDPLTELQNQLQRHPDFKLSARNAARVVDKLRREMMNQKSAKDSNQWWTSNSWVSPFVSMKVGKLRRLEGHLRTGGKLVDLRRITDTAGLIRNDMAVTAGRGRGSGGSSAAAGRIGGEPPLSLGEHLVLPRWDVAFMASNRSTGRSLSAESTARTMLTRKATMIRYLATVATDMTLDSSRGQLGVRRNATVELVVPAPYADAFEEQILATPALREVFAKPPHTVVTMPETGRSWRNPMSSPAPKAWPGKGARTPADLRKIAEKHRIEVSVPDPDNPGPAWAWAHRGTPARTWAQTGKFKVRFRHPENGDFEYAGVDEVPVFRYRTDPANTGRIIGATVFTKGTVHPPGGTPQTDVVAVEFVRNPAFPAPAAAAVAGDGAAVTPPPWHSSGVRDAIDLYVLAKQHPIEIAVAGRSGARTPQLIENLPDSLHTLWLSRQSVLLRGDGDYTYAAGDSTAARFRYVVDERGMVVSAIPLGNPVTNAGVTTRAAGTAVPNPALSLPARQPSATPAEAVRQVQRYLDGVTAYTQIQLSTGVPAQVTALLSAHPQVELLDQTGARVPGQVLPTGPRPAEATRGVVHSDGWVNQGLKPLSGPTREPWALAARSGLGPGALKEMPGTELIFADVLMLVEQQMRAVGKKLTAQARQERFWELAAKFGAPGLRGGQRSLFDGGITDTYTVGDLTFHVNLTGTLGDLRDIETIPDYWVDNRNVGAGGHSVSESLSRRWGTRLDLSTRLGIKDFFGMRVRVADVQLAWDRTHARSAAQSSESGRRRKIGGLVTAFNHGTHYQLTVTVTDKNGKEIKPASSRAYDGEALVHVADTDLAPLPAPAPAPASDGITPVVPPPPTGPPPLLTDEQAVSRLTPAEAADMERWLAGADVTGGAGELVSGVRDNSEGMYIWLNRVGKLAEGLQRFVDVVDGHLKAPKAGSLDELLAALAPGGERHHLEEGIASGITPDFLEPRAGDMMSRTGAVVPLAKDGDIVRQLRVFMVPAHARYVRPTDDPTLKEYSRTGVRAAASETSGRGFSLQTGPALIFQTGKGAAGLHDQDAHVAASSRMADHINVTADVNVVQRSSETETVVTGGKEGTRASFEGRSYTHSSDALFMVFYERYSDGALWSAPYDLKLAGGLETSTPYVLAGDLTLPVPATDRKTVPTETRDLRPIHPELAYATSHVSTLTANQTTREQRTRTVLQGDRRVQQTREVTVIRNVLQVVEDKLAGMGVDVKDPAISGALATLFRDSALKRHYRTIRKEGIYQLITLERKRGTRQIGIRLTARDDRLVHERPRPDAKTTISGASTAATAHTEGTSTTVVAGTSVDGRFMQDTARIVIGAEAGHEWERADSTTESTAVQMRRRGGPLDLGSQEFGADTRFSLEFFETTTLPQAVETLKDVAKITAKVADTITDGRVRKRFQSLFPAGAQPSGRAHVGGHVSVLTPNHLTRIGPPRTPAGTMPLPATLADLPPSRVTILNGAGPDPSSLPADLRADATVTRSLAPDLFGLETYGFEKFADFLPAIRQPGAERLDTDLPAPRVADYGPLSTVAASMKAALAGENVSTHIGEMFDGSYTVFGDGGDAFTVQAVLRQGRWLGRGGYDQSNAPLHAEELEQEHERESGFEVAPLEVASGHSQGGERAFVGTGLGVAKGEGTGSASGVSDYAIQIARRKGDHDYIWFDVTLIGRSSNGRSWIRGEVPFGLLARIPSEKAAAVFGPQMSTLGLVDQALLRGLSGDVVVPYPDRRFLVDALAKQRTRPAPNLNDFDERADALRRALDWTRATEMAPSAAGAAAPPVTPADCVDRAFALFVAVHRRTTNVTTDVGRVGHRTAEDVARALGGEFLRIRDPQAIKNYLEKRPGAMLMLRVPPDPGGESHVFWVMSIGQSRDGAGNLTGPRRLRVFDGQAHGVSYTDADLGDRRQALTGTLPGRQALTGTLLGRHAQLFWKTGTEALLLDPRGQAVDMLKEVSGGTQLRQPGDRLGRRESGRLQASTPFRTADAELRSVLSTAGPGAVKQPPVAAPSPAAELPGRNRELHPIGDFSSPAGQRTLDQIREGMRHSAGGPVIAVSLTGTPETAAATVRQLDEMLRNEGWRGRSPVVVATMGTKKALDAFAEVRAARRPVTLQEGMAGFDRVWQLLEPGVAHASTMEPAPNANLFRRADALPAHAAGGALTPALAEWIGQPGWTEAEAYQRAHDAELRTGTVRAELAEVVAAHPSDLRLRSFQTLLAAADRAGGVPAVDSPRLSPHVRSFLDVEPVYDAAARGRMPVSFLYDYLRSSGATRRERYPLDGLLFGLMVAGELDYRTGAELARATSPHKVDRANATVFEIVSELMRTSHAELLADPAGVTYRFVELARMIASTSAGALPWECLDPVDRTAWVGRLDMLRDLLRGRGDEVSTLLASVIDAVTYTLSNC
ncbi:hypothetical protein JCM9534A_75690 [Catenuloplanes indicus JCM 9534]